jgi:hypothetical protein
VIDTAVLLVKVYGSVGENHEYWTCTGIHGPITRAAR